MMDAVTAVTPEADTLPGTVMGNPRHLYSDMDAHPRRNDPVLTDQSGGGASCAPAPLPPEQSRICPDARLGF